MFRSNHTHLPDKEGDVSLSLESHPSVPAVGTECEDVMKPEVLRFDKHRPFGQANESGERDYTFLDSANDTSTSQLSPRL